MESNVSVESVVTKRYHKIDKHGVKRPNELTQATLAPGSYSGRARRTAWRRAREVRAQLKPMMEQSAVAKLLLITRSAVEQIELRALTKIIKAFEDERISDRLGI